MLGSLILYLKGMRIIMFQLSGFYYNILIVIVIVFVFVQYNCCFL